MAVIPHVEHMSHVVGSKGQGVEGLGFRVSPSPIPARPGGPMNAGELGERRDGAEGGNRLHRPQGGLAAGEPVFGARVRA